MRIRDRLSYANVTATLALVVALATGGAYAQSRIGTNEIQNRAVTSKKIKKGAVRNANVRGNALRGAKIRERTLNALQFSAMNGAQTAVACDPTDGTYLNCVTTTLQLESPGRVLVVATAGAFSAGMAPASGRCEVRVNGEEQPLGQLPGEASVVNTSEQATNGFARTLVTPLLPAGSAIFALACRETGSEDFRVRDSTIAAIALTNGR